ncbi:allantoicase, putative [Plasmodium ovale curtisi]|uniref:Allantoicase, putative n=1 Tax=Plasmodium ovale curtisi TaxID=864141 RepID=A0A1A8WRT4_PLAOA|nr:allantoicase, putative [Plasmodium ovale curtisi]
MSEQSQSEDEQSIIIENNTNNTKKRKLSDVEEDDESSDSNELIYIPKKKRRRKILTIFNDLFSWIINKNVKNPSKEIENINDVNFLNFNNVLSKNFGSKVLFVTDESISKSENLIIDDKSGWITRRRRDVGHEWLIFKLKYPSIIYGIELNFENMDEDICPHLSIEVVENPCIDDIIKDEELIINETDNKDVKAVKRKSVNGYED